jgi:oxygen-independent coproporphyrinogen III oxidase
MPTSQVTVDLDLIRKYDLPGPRYTSYPPANHFASQYAPRIPDQIQENNRTAGDLSLYFHLPFCKTLCWYCGCNNVITRRQGQSAVYLSYLEKEIDLLTRELNPGRRVVQLHWGGGTPTFLTPDEIRWLGDLTRRRFPNHGDIEASVEIDPRRFTDAHIQALCEAGFNRVSMGVQDHNPEVQKAINRIQPREQTEEVFRALRGAGFSSISVDLIYGLPLQTVDSFSKTIDEVLALKPDRMAIFSYAHVPWIKPAQKLLEKAGLPATETKFQLLKLSVEKLTGNGYACIGMDHFARADNDLAVAQTNGTLQRNFQGYSTRAGADVYGIGNSSMSQTAGAYWQNEKKLEDYYKDLDNGRLPIWSGYVLSPDDRIRRQTIMRLMCDFELNYAAMSRNLDIEFDRYFATELESLHDLEDDGLIELSSGGLRVTSTGRLLVRVIAMRFDQFLTTRKSEHVYSRTI